MGKPIKVTFIGDVNVGKSSIVKRLSLNTFSDNRESTIGAAFATIKEKDRVFHIWDTAGQERFGSLLPLYLSGAAIIIIVFDITQAYSFERVQDHWLPFIRKNLRIGEDDQKPMMYLIGNKSDLAHQRRVPHETAKVFADANGMQFTEASAKTAAGVRDIFENLMQHHPICETDDSSVIILNERKSTSEQQWCSKC